MLQFAAQTALAILFVGSVLFSICRHGGASPRHNSFIAIPLLAVEGALIAAACGVFG